MSEEILKPPISVYKKLLEIQREVVGLGKDSKGFGFTYVSGNKVINHIKPIMNRIGLLLLTEIVNTTETRQDYNVLKKVWADNGQGGKVQKEVPIVKSEMFVKTNIRFTWVCVDTGETLVSLWDGIGFNDWDKGIGSAITYSERYFLLKTFHINTDEDDIDNPESNENKRLSFIENQIKNTWHLDTLKKLHGELSEGDKLLFRDALNQQTKHINNQFNNNQNNGVNR